jgi:glycolate oxidase FAD binding subunit
MTASLLHPTSLAELRDAVRVAGTVAVAGAGTAARWAGDLEPVDHTLDSTGLTGVIVHNPGDMTVAVRAGTPLRALNEELAPHGQRVAFDAARVAEGATVGGLLATADAGPGALVYGSLRDLVIGVTLVLPDGSVARSGGHVIKNVAGYDLAKVMHGSYGVLGVVAEVVLRLHPIPEAVATIAVECPLEQAPDLAAAVLGGPYEPAALEWTDGQALIRLEGTADALGPRAARVEKLLGAHERHCRPTTVDDSAVRAAWFSETEARDAVLRIGVRPSRLAPLVASLPVRGASLGLGTGVATVRLDPADVASAHTAVHAVGGTSVLRARPAGSDAPAWGPAPSSIGVLRAVKKALDPDDRFGPGRFSPWM